MVKMFLAPYVSLLAACSSVEGDQPMTENLIASNAFFYYEDLQGAWSFYGDLLGMETVADYGFAKIMRVAETSYVTLVDAERGMHSAEEPKTVAIALVTDQLDEWYEYLRSAGVTMRSGYDPVAGRPHDGFVIHDPEGYFLEFERFNPHPENARFTPMLEALPTVPSGGDPGSAGLGFKATVLWLYYRDLAGIQRFYEDALGLEMVVDQGWTKIYPTSRSGFLGLVDEARGMHSWTEEKGITVSFITEDIEGWFERMKSHDAFEFRSPEIGDESGRVRVFVGYDPEGYFLEFDTFLDEPGNEQLMGLLKQHK